MKIQFSKSSRLAVVCMLIALGASHAAIADEHEQGHSARVPILPQYKQECAACHVAYPPGMLPAASWQRIMGNLQHHFGTDASLDAKTSSQIGAWLTANADTYRRARAEPPQDRITRSAWFIREHDEIPASVWKRPAVKSASNCSACHTQADQGDFNEHNVRIPR